ncbi:MAG: hypothetical protein IK142_00730 [Clostridiales bacterium]|nr:hypothetical protein [Clostridiales bacterium]
MKHPVFYEREELFDVNMIITMIVTVNGPIPEDKMREAFAEAVRINEILNSRIAIEDDGSAFYADNDKPRSFIEVTDEDLDEVRKQQERVRFRIEEGEYVRAFAKRGEGKTTLLFMMHHIAGDGKSLLYFVEDYMAFFAQGERSVKKIRTAETVKKLDPISTAIVRRYNRKWNGHVFTIEDLDKAHEMYWKERTTYVETEVLEKEQMDAILDECRKSGVKYTAYLTASLIKDEKGVQDIGYATNYRHDGNRSMGNQASGISVKHKYDPAKSVYENARVIQKKFTRKYEADNKASYILNFMSIIKPTLVDAICLEHTGFYSDETSDKFARLLGFKGKTKDYSITNLTVADIPTEYGEFSIDQISFIGPVVSYGKNIISVITCNGKTVITRHHF